MSDKVWFITGASRGFGRIWAEAALKRGDKVAATARIFADVADLSESYGDAVLPIALDVTNAQAVQDAVTRWLGLKASLVGRTGLNIPPASVYRIRRRPRLRG